tara:strand:+ start:1408 stop:1989 length:582 start_codon:yes stop_codon:yes gene_type:complete
VIRALVHIACALPAILLFTGWQYSYLGVDPEKTLIWETGIWGFNLILVVLLLPVAAKWANWPELRQYRRAVGLWAFFYATAHFFFFVIFLLGWNIGNLPKELSERPYITFGFGAWCVLFAMAITSNHYAVKHLKRAWKKLHILVYVAATLAAIHYILMVRSDYGWASTYALIVLLLCGTRLLRSKKTYRWLKR